MTWKTREASLKCRKCKTHEKLTPLLKGGVPVLHCHGCNDSLSHPMFTALVSFGCGLGAENVKRELRGMLGLSAMKDLKGIVQDPSGEWIELEEKKFEPAPVQTS